MIRHLQKHQMQDPTNKRRIWKKFSVLIWKVMNSGERLVKKHSEFIGYDIELQVEKSSEKEVTDDEAEEAEAKKDGDDEPKVEEVDDKKEAKKTKKVKKSRDEDEDDED